METLNKEKRKEINVNLINICLWVIKVISSILYVFSCDNCVLLLILTFHKPVKYVSCKWINKYLVIMCVFVCRYARVCACVGVHLCFGDDKSYKDRENTEWTLLTCMMRVLSGILWDYTLWVDWICHLEAQTDIIYLHLGPGNLP